MSKKELWKSIGVLSDAITDVADLSGDVAGLLVDLIEDVHDLAARLEQHDITERISGRISIASDMIKLGNDRRDQRRAEWDV